MLVLRRWLIAKLSPKLQMLIIPTRNSLVVQVSLRVWKMTIEPMEPGGGYEFTNKIVGGAIPKEYIPGVEKGIESVRKNGGIIAGFPHD